MASDLTNQITHTHTTTCVCVCVCVCVQFAPHIGVLKFWCFEICCLMDRKSCLYDMTNPSAGGFELLLNYVMLNAKSCECIAELHMHCCMQ